MESHACHGGLDYGTLKLTANLFPAYAALADNAAWFSVLRESCSRPGETLFDKGMGITRPT